MLHCSQPLTLSLQDDFLGSITIPAHKIPSTGVEMWFKLEGTFRINRKIVQLGIIIIIFNLFQRKNDHFFITLYVKQEGQKDPQFKAQ